MGKIGRRPNQESPSQVKYQPLRLAAYNYDFPTWGHLFGWFLSLSSMLCIPVYAIYKWIITEGTVSEVLRLHSLLMSIISTLQKFTKLFRPKIDFAPKVDHKDSNDYKMEEFT